MHNQTNSQNTEWQISVAICSICDCYALKNLGHLIQHLDIAKNVTSCDLCHEQKSKLLLIINIPQTSGG